MPRFFNLIAWLHNLIWICMRLSMIFLLTTSLKGVVTENIKQWQWIVPDSNLNHQPTKVSWNLATKSKFWNILRMTSNLKYFWRKKSTEFFSTIKRGSCANWLKYDLGDSFLGHQNICLISIELVKFYCLQFTYLPQGKYQQYINFKEMRGRPNLDMKRKCK